VALLKDREVVRLDWLWREAGEPPQPSTDDAKEWARRHAWFKQAGAPWLVSFFLAELDGRLECVGFSVRSFLMVQERAEDGLYDAWCPRIVDRHSPEGIRLQLALAEGGQLDPQVIGQLGDPMPLSATKVRELPFGSLLARATRHHSGAAGRYAGYFADKASDLGIVAPGTDDAELLDGLLEAVGWHRRREDAVASMQRRRTRAPGDRVQELERIAGLYEHFYRGGSNSPTRDVAEALNMSRSTVAKRIMKCRDAGLLAPTRRGIPGGLRDGEDGQ